MEALANGKENVSLPPALVVDDGSSIDGDFSGLQSHTLSKKPTPTNAASKLRTPSGSRVVSLTSGGAVGGTNNASMPFGNSAVANQQQCAAGAAGSNTAAARMQTARGRAATLPNAAATAGAGAVARAKQ